MAQLTPSPLEPIGEYIIYPVNGLDPAIKDTQSALEKLQGSAPVVPYTSLYDGVTYWLTNCTATQSETLGGVQGVCASLLSLRRLYTPKELCRRPLGRIDVGKYQR